MNAMPIPAGYKNFKYLNLQKNSIENILPE